METKTGTWIEKKGLAQMLKGGVIMDVVNAEQARIAEEAGACAVMALERVPADIRADGGVARMSDPDMILKIIDAVSIPVMAKCRIGHFVEAQILESLGIDYIDESEVRNIDYQEYLYWTSRVYGETYPEVWKRALPDTLVWREELAFNEPDRKSVV